MLLATSQVIRDTDHYAVETAGISITELIDRSGRAVAQAVRENVPQGGRVVILVGAGNNGADGYAAARHLLSAYTVCVVDTSESGPCTDGAKAARDAFVAAQGCVRALTDCLAALPELFACDCLVDAIFGTGFHGSVPQRLLPLNAPWQASRAYKIAVDIPLGTVADTAEVCEGALSVDATVALCMYKPAHVCYPAKDYVGEVTLATVGLDAFAARFAQTSAYRLADKDEARALLPTRPANAHKGTFGRTALLVGSATYRGAARLALEAALRCGVGYVHCFTCAELVPDLSMTLPEVIYTPTAAWDRLTDADIEKLLHATEGMDSVMIGSGCGVSEGLYRLTVALLSQKGCTLILDADALNSVSRYGDVTCLKNASRARILTPHPLELSRLCGHRVTEIAAHRLPLVATLANAWDCILLIKGAATVTSNGTTTYINASGSSALAKAGSGDVLAGAIASFSAFTDPLTATALAVYLHGTAADTLTRDLSAFGVLPSELPRAMARAIADLTKEKQQ